MMNPISFFTVQKGVVHRWANESDGPAGSLVFLVPDDFDEFLMKIGKPADDPDQTNAPPTKEEIDFAISITGDYHMEVMAP